MPIRLWSALQQMRKIDFGSVRLLAVDIDGTLTDGLLYDGGKDALGWTQAYHVRDGEAIKRLAKSGIPVVPISRNKTRCAHERMASLGLPTRWVGIGDKTEALKAVIDHYSVPAAAVAYVGDGPEDAAVFAGVGLGCAVADADVLLLQVADFISQCNGGRGAVSDVASRILAAQTPSGGGAKAPRHGKPQRLAQVEVAVVFAAGAIIGTLATLSCVGREFGTKMPMMVLLVVATLASLSCARKHANAQADVPTSVSAAHSVTPLAPFPRVKHPSSKHDPGLGEEPLHPKARDYLQQRSEFRLEHLTTEQRHEKTWSLSATTAQDTASGLRMLWSVDDDIVALIHRLAKSPQALIAASREVEWALQNEHRVLLYGCGSTGRLARTLEVLWRQFFARAEQQGVYSKHPRLFAHLKNAVVGEITGGDRALISSLEGFEDLPLIGELQLASHNYRPQDVLFAISEGGETSSVLGALFAARKKQQTPNGRTFFVFNNPTEQLMKLQRSRIALDDPGINQLNLTTGPQAIAGSTRMQATSAELLVLGTILEDALTRLLAPLCSEAEMAALQLDSTLSIMQRLYRFEGMLEGVRAQAPALARFTDAETVAYQAGRHATYRADRALAAVFTDATERSPTFRLAPLDPIEATPTSAGTQDAPLKRHAWLHVASSAQSIPAAWRELLGRDFLGLDIQHFATAIEARVSDKDLLAAARRSLERAGSGEGKRYDLSAASLMRTDWRPQHGDFYLSVGLDDETWPPLDSAKSDEIEAHRIVVADLVPGAEQRHADTDDRMLTVSVPSDPLALHKNLAVKLLLNAHSTAVMCKMGRVVGNTMAYVQPSNLKLVGRATFLIQSHINDVLRARKMELLSYEQANSLLFQAIDIRSERARDTDPSEVSIAVAMGVLRHTRPQATIWSDAIDEVQVAGLEAFKQSQSD